MDWWLVCAAALRDCALVCRLPGQRATMPRLIAQLRLHHRTAFLSSSSALQPPNQPKRGRCASRLRRRQGPMRRRGLPPWLAGRFRGHLSPSLGGAAGWARSTDLRAPPSRVLAAPSGSSTITASSLVASLLPSSVLIASSQVDSTQSTASSMQIFIEYANGEKRAPLEIDPSESLEFLRFQIYSLTGIPPSEQNIVGAGTNELAQIKTMQLTPGQRVMVTRKLKADSHEKATAAAAAAASASASASAATAASAASPARPVAVATSAARPFVAPAAAASASSSSSSFLDMAALRSCCSRSFFGIEEISQPAATATVGEATAAVCFACAQTCLAPGSGLAQLMR